MTRSRGNKTSKAQRAERHAREIAMMNEGKTQDEIKQELGISRQTFWRDIQAIESRCTVESATDLQQFKQAQYQALMKIEDAAAKGVIEPEVANTLVRVRDAVAKLLGLNAPTKSISVRADAGPHDIRFLKFKKFCSGLTDEQLEEVYRFAAGLERKRVEMNPEFFHEPQLLEGNVNVDEKSDQGQGLEAGENFDRESDHTVEP